VNSSPGDPKSASTRPRVRTQLTDIARLENADDSRKQVDPPWPSRGHGREQPGTERPGLPLIPPVFELTLSQEEGGEGSDGRGHYHPQRHVRIGPPGSNAESVNET